MIGSVTAQRTLFDGEQLDDVASVSLPDITATTTTVNLPGGEVDLPSTLYGAMEITVSFRGLNSKTAVLYDTGVHKLEHRYVQEELDENGGVREQLAKAYADVIAKNRTPGTPEMGAQQENEASFEVLRYRLVVDGVEILLIDKRTGQIVINGKDRSSERLNLLK